MFKFTGFPKPKFDFNEIFSLERGPTDWEEFFSTLTAEQFFDLGNGALEQIKRPGAISAATFNTICFFLGGFAKYAMEFAHFQKGLSDSGRSAAIGMAEEMMKVCLLVESYNTNPDRAEAWKTAFAGTMEHCENFGYKSGPIYEALASKKFFKE